MTEFWVASGHHLTRLDASGRMQVTDALLLAWLARPELLPPPEACAAERALHARLLDTPRAEVAPEAVAALADPDARENWGFLLSLRDALLAAGTVEGGYLDLVRRGVRLPVVFLNQLVQLVLRNALDGCQDVATLRAAEMLFRPQKGHVRDGALILADEELVAELDAEMRASPLAAMLKGGVEQLDILGAGNGWTYWSRSDAHSMALNFGGDQAARAGLAAAMTAFLRHLLGFDLRIEALTSIEGVDFRWFIGLDEVGTRIGNALWRGETPETPPIGLFRLDLAPGVPVRPALAGQPVWLILGMGADSVVRMKPQNLIAGLPLPGGGPGH
ncbi:DUF6352 family protein [Rhodovulum strictum]|uniref:Uncharacterized protein n=1 Tax=Rhodovulum strictum TaxID=58314 RepID=A0A844BHJ4_9RHOB|nr:DUF6352 family protein [Rhodovulum strictum]MRH21968.1 hypothetical protein [Rhodovulum strictum]